MVDQRCAEAQLDALYRQLPTVQCRGKCQQSCRGLDMTTAERRRIRHSHGVHIPPKPPVCPALGPLGTCTVYPVRPLLCRLWGVAEAMPCPHGCRPDPGYLTDREVVWYIARAVEIGGVAGSSLPEATTAEVDQGMGRPDLAAAVAAALRDHGDH